MSPVPNEFAGSAMAAELASHGAKTAIILGSGLGGAVDAFEAIKRLPYTGIPGLPISTVPGHAGVLTLRQGSKPFFAAQGRVHLYEGQTPQSVSAMVRLLAAAGIEQILLTNAAGSTRSDLPPGSWMLISDHINFTAASPLTGHAAFVPMEDAYDPTLRSELASAATKAGIPLRHGVYACLPGPNYETAAEVRMMGRLGADAVGMSTVFECIQARALGVRVAGLSLITNFGTGVGAGGVHHEEVLALGANAGSQLGAVLAAWL